jgi:hypothetical protein
MYKIKKREAINMNKKLMRKLYGKLPYKDGMIYEAAHVSVIRTEKAK